MRFPETYQEPGARMLPLCAARIEDLGQGYEDAIEWAERSLRELPYFPPTIRIMVISCAHLDRVAEARTWLERLLALQPGLTIANVRSGR